MNLSDEYIDRFVSELIDRYRSTSTLNKITDLHEYDNNQSGDFAQVGKRVNLPKEFFYDKEGVGRSFRSLADSFVDAICDGEIMYILDRIEKSDRTFDISTEGDELSYEDIMEAHDYITSPNHIILPREKKYFELTRDWQDEGWLRFDEGNRVILGATDITVHWAPSDDYHDSAYLINSNRVKIIQKQYGDVDRPDWIDHYFDRDLCDDDSNLMVYFGKQFKDNPAEFDFFIRVLLSQPQFIDKSSGMIRLTD